MRGSWRLNKDCNILTPPIFLAITAFLSRSPGLLNREPGGPASLLRAGSHSSILSPTDLNFLSPELFYNLTLTYFLRASQFALNSTPWQSKLPLDIFDRMHLLFTQVHFFFWQLGRGQYATLPCLTFSNIRYVSRVKRSNQGKGVVPSPMPWCSNYWKKSFRVTLD